MWPASWVRPSLRASCSRSWGSCPNMIAEGRTAVRPSFFIPLRDHMCTCSRRFAAAPRLSSAPPRFFRFRPSANFCPGGAPGFGPAPCSASGFVRLVRFQRRPQAGRRSFAGCAEPSQPKRHPLLCRKPFDASRASRSPRLRRLAQTRESSAGCGSFWPPRNARKIPGASENTDFSDFKSAGFL